MRAILLAALFLIPPTLGADDRSLAFAEAALAKVRPAPSVRGDDPEWYFSVKEVKHLATDRFWEKPWEEIAANKSDPVPGIVEFHELLKARGIRLLVVPVPAKGAIYPEALATGFAPGDAAALAPFLKRISSAGVEVLDLEPVILEARKTDSTSLLYSRQDAHFSPLAVELIAKLVAERAPLVGNTTSGDFTVGEAETLTFSGDQIVGSEWDGVVPPESLPVRYVSASGKVGVTPDPTSPVLLLGDSHTLIFHEGKEGGMHCAGAGVLDHLAVRYGLAPDLVGVRGSGLVQARKQLFFKAAAAPGYWDAKKLVIWLFSAREFTQSSDKPVTIPLTR